MAKATRKQVGLILKQQGITSPFSLKTVGFSDLARGDAQFCEIKHWRARTPEEYNHLKARLRGIGVILSGG